MISSTTQFEPLLSVILPIFNVESFVGDCLDSIYDADVHETCFEIIAVNDGSTDESMRVVSSYATIHKNIVIINQENQGLSSARMTGLSNACGKYVWFIDSDDWLDPGALSAVVKTLKDNSSDVMVNPLLWAYEDSSKNHLDYLISGPLKMEGKDVLMSDLLPIWAAPRYIIKRSLFDNPHLFFPMGLLHEDEYFGRVLLMLAKDVSIYEKPLYNYRQRAFSIMKTISIRSSYDIVTIYDQLIQFASSLPEEERKKFTFHCQRLLVKSYTINRDKWASPEFQEFKRQKRTHLISEYIRMKKTYSFKELFFLLFLTIAPLSYQKYFPQIQ